MINTTALIRILKRINKEIPRSSKNYDKEFISCYIASAPEFQQETIIMIKLFFAYNGLEKICISGDIQNVISNAIKIAEEIDDIYSVNNKEDMALICYSFLAANGYQVTKTQFMAVLRPKLNISRSRSVKQNKNNKKSEKRESSLIKPETGSQLGPNLQTQFAEQNTPEPNVIVQPAQNFSQKSDPQQDTTGQQEKKNNSKIRLWTYILIILSIVFLVYILSDNSNNTKNISNSAITEYPTTPSWIQNLGIKEAVIIRQDDYYYDHITRGFTSFAPYSGTYVFTTIDSGDTYGYISSSEDSWEVVVGDNDSGIDKNFMIIQHYEAGDLIHFRVRFRDFQNMKGDIHYYMLFVQEWK